MNEQTASSVNYKWLLLGCTGVGALAVAYFFFVVLDAPTPTERFTQFAGAAKAALTETVETDEGKQQLRDYFYYDVLRTDSELSPFKASIRYYIEEVISEYSYEYRDEKWQFRQAVIRIPATKDAPGQTEIRMGKDVGKDKRAAILLQCELY